MTPKKFYRVAAEGDTCYVTAANKAKAVEVVESTFGVPPGALHMEVTEVREADLPAGERWLK